MAFWPVPDVAKDNIYELIPRLFTNRGISLLLLDVDNTLSPYTVDEASPRLKAWARDMQEAGLTLFILSNNRGERPAHFAEELGIGYVKKAFKPFPKTARETIAALGFTPGETALIGDQIYTDTACAKWIGATAVLVKPIAFTNPLLRLRYWLEWPFRLKYHWKKMK